MDWLINLWKTEPTRIIGFCTALVAFLVSFGVQLSTNQQVAILGLVSAVLIVLGAEVTRSQVTPVSAPSLPAGTTVEVITPKDQSNGIVTL